MKILLIGRGGREHALAHKMCQSPKTDQLFIAPGSPAFDNLGINTNISVSDYDAILAFVTDNDVDLVVVGPEQPLVDGLVDQLAKIGRPAVGPTAAAAQLEGSKDFSKQFMARHNVPTAAYATFTEAQFSNACDYVKNGAFPVVLKADGLAAGKGVLICENEDEALAGLTHILQDHQFGSAGGQVVIEEFMAGEEASVFALCDGENFVLLSSAQDHKRIGEGDTGPNTGGMGAYAPAPIVTPSLLLQVEETIIKPVLAGMKAEGYPYTGFLYVGLMIENGKAKVVEFNCRLGDPETQVVLPLLKSDLVELFMAQVQGKLNQVKIELHDGSAACVVMAAEGYPGSYEKGRIITGPDDLSKNELVWHAGTAKNESGQWITNGGRVLSAGGRGKSLQEALNMAYKTIQKIKFDGVQFRNDIGQKGLKI